MNRHGVIPALVAAICAAPLSGQKPATAQASIRHPTVDSAAIRALALGETPERHRPTASVTRLALRGDTAEVTVVFGDVEYAPGKRAVWDLRLTLARRDSGWVVLPRRTISVGHYASRR